jgi:hypothetical protein
MVYQIAKQSARPIIQLSNDVEQRHQSHETLSLDATARRAAAVRIASVTAIVGGKHPPHVCLIVDCILSCRVVRKR